MAFVNSVNHLVIFVDSVKSVGIRIFLYYIFDFSSVASKAPLLAIWRAFKGRK